MNVEIFGFLTNVDQSIMKLKLEHGFKVTELSIEEGFKLFTKLYGKDISYSNDSTRILGSFGENFYIVHTSYEVESDIGVRTEEFGMSDYLYRLLQLLRLFKEGPINMPIIFLNTGIEMVLFEPPKTSLISEDSLPYTLTEGEIKELQELLKIPKFQGFLNLAHETYNLSYHTENTNLAFLSLMIALETLFNEGVGEIGYSIARNIAVLMGNDITHAEFIFQEFKKLYRKRNQLVHSGKSEIQFEDVIKARHYVRESIKKVYKIGKDKKELLALLTSCGFGEHQWNY